MRYTKITLLLIVILISAISVLADDKKQSSSTDDQSLYIVSAKSGVISLIDGEASLKRGAGSWESLLEGDELKPGDIVKTGATGRMEVLLNPGTYLRIAENSEFAFSDVSNFRLNLRLIKGTAILEASVVDVSIRFNTPQYLFTITQNGLYRFNASPETGKSELMIRKGRVMVGGEQIKEGKKVVIENGIPTIVAFDKKAEDEFETWSKTRARTIIAANKDLSNRRVKNSLTNGYYSNAWIYDPFTRSYTFLPGWGGFSSPYGFSYSRCNPYWASNPWGYSNSNNGWGNSNPWGSTGAGSYNSGQATYSKGNSTAVTSAPAAPPPSAGSFNTGHSRTTTTTRNQ